MNPNEQIQNQDKELQYRDFVDLNGKHDNHFMFEVSVTWDKFNEYEYRLFNIKTIIAKNPQDAEKVAIDNFVNEILSGKNEERRFIKAYTINYLGAPIKPQP